MASQYDQQATSPPPDSGFIDRRYIKGIPGLLKAIEMVSCLIAYVCVEASLTFCYPWVATTGFFKFITMFCFTTTLILYILLLLKLQTRIFRCDCINWPFLEAMYYGGLILFLFFGDLFMSLHACHGAHKAGVFFGWVGLFAYGTDGTLAFLTFWRSRGQPAQQQAAPPVDQPPPYDDGQPKY